MTEATIRPEDIRWRVSNTWDKGATKWGMLVGYIDARTCMDALDAMDPAWSAVHGDPIIVGQELIGVPLALTVNGVTRSDVGMPSSQEPIKGAYSDALKRAAVHHGIGRELYELPKIAVECEVGNNGKVRGPKAVPFYKGGRWDIDRKVGWVKYDREPEDQPERERGPARAAPTPSAPAPVRTPEENALIDELMHITGASYARMELLAKSVGVKSGERANADQLREMIAQASLPLPEAASAHAAPATSPGDGGPPSPVSGAPLTLDDVLEVTGGELIPPRPGTDDYKALPAQERAEARVYWTARDKEGVLA